MAYYIYPGSFCPPTRGHLRIVQRAAELVAPITIVCSKNRDKNNRWFSEEECKQMWSAYLLPSNISSFGVQTFDEFRQRMTVERLANDKFVMIRGIRNVDDYSHEQGVMELNNREFGIGNYLYLIAEPEFANISSSLVRKDAEKLSLETLHQYVAPTVISSLLEHVLGINNIIMVVGMPAAGKTTFLHMLRDIDSRNITIETDQWSDSFKPFLEERFASTDLMRLVLEQDKEVSRAIKDIWIAKLKELLKVAPKRSNVFVEAAYGMAPNKSLFRFLGGKVLYIDCKNGNINRQRLIERGMPELLPFFSRIPVLDESRFIAQAAHLSLSVVDTCCTKNELKEKARAFNTTINQNHWKEGNQ